MAEITCIRNADWAVVWDQANGRQHYRRGIDIAFAANEVVHVGDHYDGAVTREVDGAQLMVLPGLVDIHSHPSSEPLDKGFNEELGSPRLGMSGLYEYMPVMRADEEGVKAAVEVAYAELMLSGVTTLGDLSVAWPGWLELFAKSGLRGCVAPMYRSARWFTPNGYRVEYEWDEKAGRRAMEEAVRTIELARQHESGRLFGILSPSQIDTCSEDLLRDSVALAQEKDLPIQIHASQSVHEFNEMTRRHGLSPLQWLDSLGFLTPNTIVAHAIFVDSHSWIRWHTEKDIALLGERGCSIAHCPNVFVRRGILLEHLGAYLAAGVNVGIGTDTYPHNMLDEMRWAATLGHVAAQDVDAVKLGDVFHCATVGGAKALKRDDIGRLAVGAKADLVLVDLDRPQMKPRWDPLRALVYSAQDRAVRDVYVDGRQVVANGKCLTLDYEDAAERLRQAQIRAIERAPSLDWASRPMRQISPLSLTEG